MRKNLLFLGTTLVSVALIVIVFGSYVIVAQTVVTGDWTADSTDTKDGKIHLSINRSSDKGHRNQFGSDFAIEELQGLSQSQLAGGKVSFRLVREAGTVDFEGSFSNGKGSGTFRFTSDPNYVSAMKSRGFDFEKTDSDRDQDRSDRLLSAALINVTTALADDLKSVGFGNLDVDDLFKAAIFKVDSRFMAEMTATGFPNLTMEDLVKARIFKIDADYVRQVHDMGFAEKDFESLVNSAFSRSRPSFCLNSRVTDLWISRPKMS